MAIRTSIILLLFFHSSLLGLEINQNFSSREEYFEQTSRKRISDPVSFFQEYYFPNVPKDQILKTEFDLDGDGSKEIFLTYSTSWGNGKAGNFWKVFVRQTGKGWVEAGSAKGDLPAGVTFRSDAFHLGYLEEIKQRGLISFWPSHGSKGTYVISILSKGVLMTRYIKDIEPEGKDKERFEKLFGEQKTGIKFENLNLRWDSGEQSSADEHSHNASLADLNSKDPKQRLKCVISVLKGDIRYDAEVGSALVARYAKEKDPSIRFDILAALHKHKHPELEELLKPLKASKDPEDRRVASVIETGEYMKPVVSGDPTLREPKLEQKAKRIGSLSDDELSEVLDGLRSDTVKYRPQIGDDLAQVYRRKDSDLMTRVRILSLLKKFKHPSAPELLNLAKQSQDKDERGFAEAIESE